MSGQVCIVSPGSLASNPRVLKEAEALQGDGYDVTTVVCDYAEDLRGADNELTCNSPWKVVRVPRSSSERVAGAMSRLTARALECSGAGIPLGIASAAYGGPAAPLMKAAIAVRAGLYIAHYVVALPAVVAAARRHGGLLAFDAEDFHSGEGGEGAAEAFRMRLVRRVEGACLPSCSYITAASPLIGKAYEAAYGVPTTTVLNVFPLSMAPDVRPVRDPAAPPGLRAYWFSQTVGLDRGLQAFLQAMARTHTRITLDVRGSDRWRHGATLSKIARELGIADRLTLLPTAPPGEMARLAASYDLGLSLETEATESRRLGLTNKIFTYLLAGLPVMMSDTPAQAALAPELGPAATLVSLADPQAIANTLDRLAVPGNLAQAKDNAWRLGHERYNWDREKAVLLEAVRSAFTRPGGGPKWRH
jgi:hypothetical protein